MEPIDNPWLNENPWAAPDPTAVMPLQPLGRPAPIGGPANGPTPSPPSPPPSTRPHRNTFRRRLIMATAAGFLAGLLGATAVVRVRDDGRAASAPVTTPAVAVTRPATTPATVRPATTTPATTPARPATTAPSATVPSATVPSATAPSATVPSATTPATIVPAAPTPTTADGNRQTTNRVSLETGVVNINTILQYDRAEAAGTGMVLTPTGEILTNNHVVNGATSITVTVAATGASYTAKVVGTDPSHDVAVLQLEGASGLETVRLGDSATVKVGDAVTGVGNAGGKGGTPTVAPGHVTALDQTITATDESGGNAETLHNLIQVDATLQPGESGGPLYNAAGRVIGMDSAGSASTGRFRIQPGAGEGYAIPIDDALSIAKQIEAGVPTDTITIGTPAFLGIVAHDATQGGETGVSIDQVVTGSPAAKAGLQAGDRIVALDGQSIASTPALTTVLHAHKAGDKLAVTWIDAAGTSHTGSVTLAAGPAN